jgi:FkbM family methyltransferase
MSNDLFRDQLDTVGSDANVIFDVGSHTGESTLEYLVNFPRARVFAFEPHMTNFAAASDAIAIYRQRCSLHAIALADSNGCGMFQSIPTTVFTRFLLSERKNFRRVQLMKCKK